MQVMAALRQENACAERFVRSIEESCMDPHDLVWWAPVAQWTTIVGRPPEAAKPGQSQDRRETQARHFTSTRAGGRLP